MEKWMRKADIAITAAGNTLYELALFHVPCITVSHHQQHHLVASAVHRHDRPTRNLQSRVVGLDHNTTHYPSRQMP